MTANFVGWWSEDPPLDRDTASRQLGVVPNGFRVGWVGRLSDEKGPDVLVEALGTAGPAMFESELHRFLESVGYRWIARTLNTLFYAESGAAAGLGLS